MLRCKKSAAAQALSPCSSRPTKAHDRGVSAQCGFAPPARPPGCWLVADWPLCCADKALPDGYISLSCFVQRSKTFQREILWEKKRRREILWKKKEKTGRISLSQIKIKICHSSIKKLKLYNLILHF